MIGIDEALGLLERETAALEATELPLASLRGLALVEDVPTDRDFPPTDRSAMDGFAVRAADVPQAGESLEIVGEVRAGEPLGSLDVGPGQAVRIMTGAIVPPGADTVVMVEHTDEQVAPGRVRIDDVPRKGRHIRRRGEDAAAGQLAVERGVPLQAPEIAALASVGRATARVYRRPVVHVMSTGDEIVEPETVPAEYQLRNGNSRALLEQLAELGIDGQYLGIAGDARGDLDRMLAQGLEGDVLLITGGVSAGKYDLVGGALEAAGMRLLFHKVRVKPGKPILAGRRDGCLVVGLPGNPVSAYTGFVVFVAPFLRRMLGHRRWENRTTLATLSRPLRARAGRETYHLARIGTGPSGLTAHRLDYSGSGDVLALVRANGFIVTPAEGAALAPGATVPVLLLKGTFP